MKICIACGVEKPHTEFYANGSASRCKPCYRIRVRENRKKNIEYYRAYDRKRGNRQTAAYMREYRRRNNPKYRATNAVNNAVRDGRLDKPERCEDCNVKHTNLHGHHEDYDKPLEVNWLCPACHKARHVK